MHEEPTAYRVPDPGVRALFAEDSRYQAWLDVEAALAQAQAELGIIPPHAAEEITRKARLPAPGQAGHPDGARAHRPLARAADLGAGPGL